MGEEEFLEYLSEVSDIFTQDLSENSSVLIISHIDSDGLSSSTLFTKYLSSIGKPSRITFIKQLTEEHLKRIKEDESEIVVFLDLGSGDVDKIQKILTDKKVYILDHHSLTSKIKITEKLIQINPRLFGVDGNIDISSSGISYLFIKNIFAPIVEVGYLALVGAIGDMQETKQGFIGINKRIFDELLESKVIEVIVGPRIFGIYSRPLHKVLAYSTELLIPGVTGSEENAIRFLRELGISIKKGGDWITFPELDEESAKKLVTQIVLKRVQANIPNAEDIVGNIYLLSKHISKSNYLRDLRDLAYIANACGRLNKPSIAIGMLLQDERYVEMALELQIIYKKKILSALEMIKARQIEIKEEGSIILLNFGEMLEGNLVSPIASIVSVNEMFPNKKVVVVIGKEEKNKLKISVRIQNGVGNEGIGSAVKKAAEKVGGIGGGHDVAAGATIPKEKLPEFLRELKIQLKQLSIIV